MPLSRLNFQQLQWAGRIMVENTNLSSAAVRPCFNSITTSLMENIPPCSLSQIFSTMKISFTKLLSSGSSSALKSIFILWQYLHHCKRLPSHTGQEQACSRVTWLFGRLSPCRNGWIHRQIAVDSAQYSPVHRSSVYYSPPEPNSA